MASSQGAGSGTAARLPVLWALGVVPAVAATWISPRLVEAAFRRTGPRIELGTDWADCITVSLACVLFSGVYLLLGKLLRQPFRVELAVAHYAGVLAGGMLMLLSPLAMLAGPPSPQVFSMFRRTLQMLSLGYAVFGLSQLLFLALLVESAWRSRRAA